MVWLLTVFSLMGCGLLVFFGAHQRRYVQLSHGTLNSMWNSTFTAKAGKSLQSKSPMKRTAMKPKARKKRAGHDKTMLEACRGQKCYLHIPNVCLGAAGRNTVVPAHSNQQIHGKGMGLKAKDEFTVPGCAACHAWIDQGNADKDVKFKYWNAGYAIWQPIRDGDCDV